MSVANVRVGAVLWQEGYGINIGPSATVHQGCTSLPIFESHGGVMVDQNLHCSFVAVARGLHKGCLAIAACYAPQTIPVRTNIVPNSWRAILLALIAYAG